jgi:hypothetical protein
MLQTCCYAASVVFGSSAVLADTIESFNFTFIDPNAGNLHATGTLSVDVTTSQALSGSGTINSSLFVGSDGMSPLGNLSMSLATSSNIGHNGVDGLGGFLWQDSDGLLFAVGTPNAQGRFASFNF